MAKEVTCPTCNGSGTVPGGDSLFGPGEEKTCPNCNGTGKIYT